jgi:CheY-like chemotaxis protein
MTIRVLVADDEPLIRAGLRMILEEVDDVDVVAEAADGEEAVELATRLARTWSSWTCACPSSTASGDHPDSWRGTPPRASSW